MEKLESMKEGPNRSSERKTKLDEVSRMVASVSEENPLDDFHRKAIRKWWSLMQEFEMEPTRIDHALYATLDGKWEFEELSLENNFDDFED